MDESGNGTSAGTRRLVTQRVLAVAEFKRDEATEIPPAVHVPLGQPLPPSPLIRVFRFAPFHPFDVDAEAVAQREFAVNGLVSNADEVDSGVLDSWIDTVGPVAGYGVGLDVIVDEVSDFVSGDPSGLEVAVAVAENQFFGCVGSDEDVNSGGDVVAVERKFDADFGASSSSPPWRCRT